MSLEILESDWKVFKQLQKVALDRCCQKVLDRIAEVSAQKGKSPHDKYGEIYDIMEESDANIARLFDNSRRSNAAIQIMAIREEGLWTDQELARFSPQVRNLKLP